MKNKILSSFQELIKKLAPGGLVPPQDVPAEQSALGAALIDRNAADTLVSIIGAITDDTTPFYHIPHTLIYQAIYGIIEKGSEPCDLITVTNQLRSTGTLDAAGGASELVELSTKVVTTVNTEAYARIILEHWLNREFIKQCELSKLKAFSGEYDVFDMLSEHEAVVSKLSDVRHSKTNKFRTLTDASMDAMSALNEADQNPGKIIGMPSGLADLDDMTGGWKAGELIVVAARPGVGKTSMGTTFAQASNEKSTAIFSLEMGAMQLGMRMLCGEARVDMHRARRGRLTDTEWKAVTAAHARFTNSGIHIFDVRNVNAIDIRSAARRLSTRLSRTNRPLGQIIVDYIGLVELPNEHDEQREIGILTKQLRNLGQELEVPVIALCQLNRELESRKDKRPQLSDLRASGHIEQDADSVILLSRPEMAGIVWDEARQCHTDGLAEVNLIKQRNGPTGVMLSKFIKSESRFENWPVNLFGTDQRFKEEDDRQANPQGGF